MSLIHSFSIVERANGNVNVLFYVDNKLRQIILVKGTQALKDFRSLCCKNKEDIKGNIKLMQQHYRFNANMNNKSILRPVHRSQTLQSVA